MHISACHLTRQAREVSGMDASPIGETLEDGDAADIADMMEASEDVQILNPLNPKTLVIMIK